MAVLRGALFEADTLLLDEPFSGIDPERRDKLSRWLLEKWSGRRIIVVSHGGKLRVRSKVGVGTVFEIELPCAVTETQEG